ncbi:InlB B-repeat-containing protein [Enterococcus sp. AZ196]|uniref:InlB B-repeat-containing protein n=1 Tax=Enterococcus sp. AZ196 TaxID=2774659 RepID=UPI003D2D9DC3
MKKNAARLMLLSIFLVTLCEPIAKVYANQVPAMSSSSSLSEASRNSQPASSSNAASTSSPAESSSASKAPQEGAIPSESKSAAETEQLTATFINGNEVFNQSKVHKNERVPYPGEPAAQAGQISFIGWFTDPVAGSQFDFATPLQKSTTFYARFSQTYLVQYKDNAGKLVDSKEVKPEERIPKSTVELTPPAGEHFSYWYIEGDSTQTPFNFEAAKADKNLVLVPKFTAERTVLFVSNGSQVDPQYIKDGKAAAKPADPVRDGYTFSHWSTEENGSVPYDFNTPIAQDITLYAVWTPEKVNYTIAYWIEKPNLANDPGNDAANYNFAWSTERKGQAGESLSVDQDLADSIKNSSTQGKAALNYSDYAFSEKKGISGSGQTIINVYYKRTVYKVKFALKNAQAEMDANGQHITGSDPELYTISAKYGQDIKELWPSNPTVKNSSLNFQGWLYPSDSISSGNISTGNPITLTNNLISTTAGKKELTLTADYTTTARKNVRKMYVESLDKTDELFEDRYYDLFDTQIYYSASGGYIEDPIYGFTFYKDQIEDSYNGSYYYLRNKHTLTYNTQGGEFQGADQSVVKKYQETITAPKDPTREGYVFAGWYLDSDYRQKVDFDHFVMPDSDTTFFAKWESNQDTVHYFDSLGGKQLLQQGYADNDHIVFPSNYVKGKTYVDGKGVFNGWFWQVGSSSFEFSDTIPITHDIDLYAKWQTDGFHVTYDLGAGTGTLPVDEKDYDLTTRALIKNDDGIKAPAGKVFIGWQSDQESTIYYPEDHMQVRGDTKLTAVYAAAEDVIHVTYHAGDYADSPADVSQKALKNTNISLQGALFERPGKTLSGWSKTAAGAKDYDLGERNFAVGTTDSDLYAVWENKKVTITFLPGENGTLDYNNRSITTAVDYGTAWEDALTTMPEPKPDAGYTFAGWAPVLPAANEEMTKDQIFTAQFIKKAEGSVTVRYVDENGETIAADQTVSGTEGEAYDVSGPKYTLATIKNYHFDHASDNLTGTFTEGNILILLTYKKEAPAHVGNVVVKYLDTHGNKIHPDLELNGDVESTYDIKGSNILIDGYRFLKTTGTLTGRFSEALVYITHIYEKNTKEKDSPKQPDNKQENPKIKKTAEMSKTKTYKKIPSRSRGAINNKNIQSISTKSYPKTGEKTSPLLKIAGLLVIILVIAAIFLRRKNQRK